MRALSASHYQRRRNAKTRNKTKWRKSNAIASMPIFLSLSTRSRLGAVRLFGQLILISMTLLASRYFVGCRCSYGTENFHPVDARARENEREPARACCTRLDRSHREINGTNPLNRPTTQYQLKLHSRTMSSRLACARRTCTRTACTTRQNLSISRASSPWPTS